MADPTYRRFMLDALAQAMPYPPRSGIRLEVLTNGQELFTPQQRKLLWRIMSAAPFNALGGGRKRRIDRDRFRHSTD